MKYTFIYYGKDRKKKIVNKDFDNVDEARAYGISLMKNGKVCWMNKIPGILSDPLSETHDYVGYPAGLMHVFIRKGDIYTATVRGHLYYEKFTGKASWQGDGRKGRYVSDKGRLI